MESFEDPYWSLMQLLAWVFLRDPQWVHKCSESVTDHGTFKRELVLPDGRREMVESQAAPPTPLKLEIAANVMNKTFVKSHYAARDEVLLALQKDQLRAWGRENNRGELKPIEPVQWARMTFYYDPIFAGPKKLYGSDGVRWYDLIFSRENAMTVWPDPLVAPAMTAEVRGLLHQERLYLQHIINIAAGKPPDDWPPGYPWEGLFRDLKMAMEADELDGLLRPPGGRRHAVKLKELWDWLRGKDQRWEPLRDLCRKWAAARQIDMPSSSDSSAVKLDRHVLTTEERRDGGRQERHDRALQTVINAICATMEKAEISPTETKLRNWFLNNHGESNALETGVNERDWLYFNPDDNRLYWNDEKGTTGSIAIRSLKPYIDRWRGGIS